MASRFIRFSVNIQVFLVKIARWCRFTLHCLIKDIIVFLVLYFSPQNAKSSVLLEILI